MRLRRTTSRNPNGIPAPQNIKESIPVQLEYSTSREGCRIDPRGEALAAPCTPRQPKGNPFIFWFTRLHTIRVLVASSHQRPQEGSRIHCNHQQHHVVDIFSIFRAQSCPVRPPSDVRNKENTQPPPKVILKSPCPRLGRERVQGTGPTQEGVPTN